MQEEEYLRRPAVKIFLPELLKAALVDDWEKVTRENRLVPLPSKAPVSLFLDDYTAAETLNRRPGSAESDILSEVVAGVREYFNNCLGRMLLYKQERPQWQEIHAQFIKGTGELAGKSVADVYGVEHLCRLFGMYYKLCHGLDQSTNSISLLARSDRTHEHGLAISRSSARRDLQDDDLVKQKHAEVRLGGVRARHAGISG